jgi:hypothetical protein
MDRISPDGARERAKCLGGTISRGGLSIIGPHHPVESPPFRKICCVSSASLRGIDTREAVRFLDEPMLADFHIGELPCHTLTYSKN